MLSVFLFFATSDFPEDASWLTPAEKAFVKNRLKEDVGYSQHEEKLTLRTVWDTVRDRKSLKIYLISQSSLLNVLHFQ